MIKYIQFLLLFSVCLIFLPETVEGECNGINPNDGESWIIDELTHCWDQEIEVHDIEVNDGGLRLENITLTAHGKITIGHPSVWEASTIIHNTSNNEDTILLESQLTIKGTNLTINAPEGVFAGSDVEGIRLDLGSKLIITDVDDNPLTGHDVSTVSSLNWNTSDPFNGGIEIFSYGQDDGIILKNSVFHHIIQFKNHGDNVIISNNSFYNCSKIQQAWGDGLLFENNKVYNITTDVGVRYWGNNGLIQNNYFEGEGGMHGNGGAIHVIGNNNTVHNNTFLNMNYGGVVIGTYGEAANITITNNSLSNVQNAGISLLSSSSINDLIAHNTLSNVSKGIRAIGEDLNVFDNRVDNCGWEFSVGYVGGCISIAGGGDGVYRNISVFDNKITNAQQVGLIIGTASVEWGNLTIYNNSVEGAMGADLITDIWFAFGYGLFLTSSTGEFRPDNVNCFNNTFSERDSAISVYRSYEDKNGNNYLFNNNIITNSSNGFDLYGTSILYQNLTVTDNHIITNGTAIYVDDIDGIHVFNNNIQSNIGIEVLDSKKIHIFENDISVSRTGIVVSNSEGNITDNLILGNCNTDICDVVYFTKVAESGIKILSLSDINAEGNVVGSFNVLVNSTNSYISLRENHLDYANTGININDGKSSEIYANKVSNSSMLINSINSQGIQIYENNFSNFGKAYYSKNSTSNLLTNYYNQGQVCLEFIDSVYSVANYDNFDCTEAFLYEKFNLNVNILTDDGVPSPNHQFYYYNEFNLNKEYSQTGVNGLSNYLTLTTLKIDNSGLNINFNNYYFGYLHNEILTEIELELTRNETVMAYLDTSAPSTTLSTSSSLINTEIITLYFNKTSEKNDLMDYDIFVLKNDGVNFAQWEFVGTFNESSINYEGEDDTKYRFKVISRDIYGNIETKDNYDCEVEVDSQTPESFFLNIKEDYYFTGNSEILLDWDSEDEDINKFEINIFYNSDVTPYLNDNSNDWILENTLYYYEKDSLFFNLESIGHYGFKLVAQDDAGNQETKSSFDFIVNYDPMSDRLTFADIPKRWGEETLEIEIDSSNLFLDFSLYMAMESVDYSTNKMTWYEYSNQDASETLVLEGLLDRTKYYVYAKSVDLAGNIEDPLNSTEIFASDGTYNQKYLINYIPLAHGDYDFLVSVDNDFDGTYETILSRGSDQGDLNSNEYYLDVTNKSIIFGGISNGGFIPNEDLDDLGNIKVQYSGVHAIIEVYTGKPLPAQGINVNPTNITHIVFDYNIPTESERCKVQLTTNISKGWFNEEIIEPCYKGDYNFTLLNPQLDKEYFFRIVVENEFGQTSYSDSQSINMDDVVKLYSTSQNSDTGLLGMDVIIPITALVGVIMLGFGGVLLYRSRNGDDIEDNVNVIESKPVAKYKVEELYLIYKDGRLIKNISAVEVKTDSDIMSGMLTAINDFVQDSFNTEGDLGSIDYGNNKIILQRENHSYLAAVVYGEVDNYFKGKMINAVRMIEEENSTIENWNGDSSSIIGVQKNLEPIIAETESATREMVDNYFTEKEIAITTDYSRDNDNTNVKINLSNYSSTNITDCKIIPEYNDSLLGLNGIVPTVPYYFDKNTFEIGDIKSYNEVQFTLKMKNKNNDLTTIELKLEYNHKGRTSSTKSIVEIT